MRTNEERISAMHERAGIIKHEINGRRYRIICAVSVAACFVLIVVLAAFMPAFSGAALSNADEASMNASIFASNGALGYIVIATIAFLLGVAVVLFCFSLKKLMRNENEAKA